MTNFETQSKSLTEHETEYARPHVLKETIDVMDEVGAIQVFQLFQQYTRDNYPMIQELRQAAKSRFPNPPSGMSISVSCDVPMVQTRNGVSEAYLVTLERSGFSVSAYTTRDIGIRVVTYVNTKDPPQRVVIDQNCQGFNNFLASEFLATGAARRPTDLSARIEYGVQLCFEGMRDHWIKIL